MMNTHHIDLADYRAKARGNSVLYLGTAGSHGNEQLQVTLGDGWEGLTVQVVFHPSKVAVQLPADGLLDIPWEATAEPLTAIQGKIVFQGFDQDRLVNSTDLIYTVSSHSSTVGRAKKAYTPGVVESVLNQVAADREEIVHAAQQADQAKIVVQQAVEKVENAAAEALDNIAAAAPALPALSAASAGQVIAVKPDGSGYQLDDPFLPAEAGICPAVNGNPAVCKDSIAWKFQGLKVFGKSMQDGIPNPENPAPIVNSGSDGSIVLMVTGKNLLDQGKITLEANRVDWGTASNNVRMRLSANVDYTLSIPDGVSLPSTLSMMDGNTSETLAAADGAQSVSFTPGKDTWAYFNAYWADGRPENAAALQLEVGLVKTPYESCTDQAVKIPTPSGLPGIPVKSGGNYTDESGQQWICNLIDLGNRREGLFCKYIADLSLFKFSMHASGSLYMLNLTANGLPVATNEYTYALCSHFPLGFTEGQIYVLTNYIAFTPSAAFPTLDSFNDFLERQSEKGTPVQIAYVCGTQESQPLSAEADFDLKTLQTHADTTVVHSVEPVAGMEVRYVANGTKYLQSIDSRIRALERV